LLMHHCFLLTGTRSFLHSSTKHVAVVCSIHMCSRPPLSALIVVALAPTASKTTNHSMAV
jgi:hypothetical protein